MFGWVETHYILYVKSIEAVCHSIICYTLKDISADELMACLEAFDYEDMALKISKRFRLNDKKIAYVVDDYQKN